MALAFLDTNILLRHLLQDHPDHSPRATALLERIEAGQLQVRVSDIVIFETVYTLQRTYKTPKEQIRANVLALLSLPGIALPGKRRFRDVFDLYVNLNIPFADAYHAVMMRRLGLDEVYSFDEDFNLDEDFNKVEGITRREP